MKFNLNNFFGAVSFLLDFTCEETGGAVMNHGRRIAVLSAGLGVAAGLDEEEVYDLVSYAFLCNNGWPEAEILAENDNREVEMADHCVIGEKNITKFPFLRRQKGVVLYHHEHYDGSGLFGKAGDDIPLFSQIIALACFIAKAYHEEQDKEEILHRVQRQRSVWFAPKLVDVFAELQTSTSFYLDIDDLFISTVLKTELPVCTVKISYEELIDISRVFGKIIDAKSKFRLGHSDAVADKVRRMAQHLEYDDERKNRFLIAAYLHDIGKLAVPKEIINKKGKLTGEEFVMIKQHVYYTKRVLEEVEGFRDIARWASNHHEKLNGKGYIFGYQKNQLDTESRILSVIDIYQSLTEDRPYRTGMPHDKAIQTLKSMARNNEVSLQAVKDVDGLFGAASH